MKPFKVRELENGLAVIDVLSDSGRYERDPLYGPTSLNYADRRANALNDFYKSEE